MSQRKPDGLPKDREYELIAKAKAGDSRAMGLLIEAHTPFIMRTIKEFTLPSWVPLEDVFQEGRIGMMDAVHKFDLSSNYRLITYAYWRIKKSVMGYLSEMGYQVKLPYADVVKLKKMINRFEMGLSEDPEGDSKAIGASKNLNIQSLTSGCLPIHPTVHGGSEGDVPDGNWANGADASLVSRDSADSVLSAIIMEEILSRMGELTVVEGVMVGQYLGLVVSRDPIPLKHIAGERSKVKPSAGDMPDVTEGISGFGLEIGETYNNVSRLIRQAEARFRAIVARFLENGLYDDYLEKNP